MKFELKPYHRNISDEDFLEDLRRVATLLGKKSVTKSEYNKHGAYHSSTVGRRFGSWFKALSKADLSKTRNLNISSDECLEDLKRVAHKLNKDAVTIEEYKEHGQYSPSPLIRHFGSWFGALDKAGLKRTRNLGVSNEDYFQNIEQLWRLLGRQPHYSEVTKPLSKYSAGAYERRFGSWRKALEAFIKFVNKESDELKSTSSKVLSEQDVCQDGKAKDISRVDIIRHKTRRQPSWRLQFLVMRRDNFRCQHCGRNPASEAGVRLDIDHIKPWSKGGETVMDNLQTLCKRCNIGKSDLSIAPATD